MIFYNFHRDANTWDLSNEDFDTWERLLCHGIEKALDYGFDAVSVLDHVAATISQNLDPTFTSATRIADLLLSHVDMTVARQIPEAIIEFVNETLRSSYPPEPRNTQLSMWMIRSLTRIVETCPAELILHLLEILEEGLCAWISDEHLALGVQEYAYDVSFPGFPLQI